MSKELEAARELVKMLEEKESKNKVQLSSLNPGETFKIAENDFIVLSHKEETTLVISKGFMAEDVKFDDSTRDYNKSSLKKLIESKIQPVIEAEVGAENLVEHEVDLTSVDNQKEFKPVNCKVRPMTFDEAREYNDLLVNENLDNWTWTCTPWSTEKRGYKYSLTVVRPSGRISIDDFDVSDGVRPVCILKSNIFVSRGE